MAHELATIPAFLNSWDDYPAWVAQFQEHRQVDLPGVREAIAKLESNMARLLTEIGPLSRKAHLLPDAVARQLAWFAFSGAKGVVVTVTNGVPRAAWACSRMSVEAAQDLVYLTCAPDYDVAACRAWLAAVGDMKDERRLERSELLIEDMEEDAPEIADLAGGWKRYETRAEAIIERARTDLERDRAMRRIHWSGVQGGRRGLIKVIDQDDRWRGHPVLWQSKYKELCRWSHARPRLGPFWRGLGPSVPIMMSDMAVHAAERAIKTLRSS